MKLLALFLTISNLTNYDVNIVENNNEVIEIIDDSVFDSISENENIKITLKVNNLCTID